MTGIENIKFDRYSVQEGLSQVAVNCILQDSQGFMWFGTQDGLNRFDGYNFKIFRKNPEDEYSISNNFVTCLFEDDEGYIWAGTAGGGLNRHDRRTGKFKRYEHQDHKPGSISFNQIRSIREDSKGNFWIGTSTGGLNKFLKHEDEFIHFECRADDPYCIKSNSIRCIFEDSRKNVWFGTWGEGVKRFEHETGRFIDYKNYTTNEPNANRINSMFEDSSGKIWLATNLGLQLLNIDRKEFKTYRKEDGRGLSDNLVSAVFEYEPGILWVGTRTGGLNIFYVEEERFVTIQQSENNPKSLSNNSIMEIKECNSGNIWIATFGGGLNKISRKQKHIRHYFHDSSNSNSLSSSKVFSMYEDSEGILWIGTSDTGVNKLDRTKNQISKFPEDNITLSDNYISVIKEACGKNVLIGTQLGGLNIYNKTDKTITVYKNETGNPNSLSHNYVTSVIEDGGILWIGTYGGGLNRLDPETKEIVHYKNDPGNINSISSNKIRTMIKSSDGMIYIGLDTGGFNIFDVEEEKFTRYVNNPEDRFSISSNDVLVIHEVSPGNILIGTSNEGLNIFKKSTGKFVRYGKSDGLPNETIYGILEDDNGKFWLSTNNGISRFDPVKNVFRNYDENDGLQSNEFNQGSYLKLRSGELAFGGINGFNIINPDNFIDNEYIPETVITGFQIFNREVEYSENNPILKSNINFADEINLTYRESVFSFEFSSLDFTKPGKNQYAYFMEGFDKDWNYSGKRRFVTYTNLNPGRYVFHVTGSNNDGKWNHKGTSIKINISPPFWKTIWFKGLGLMTVAGLAGSIYRNKLKQIRKEQEAQILFTKRLLEIQESERKRIASELHDSLGHELLITKNRLLLTSKNPEDTDFMLNEIRDVTELVSGTIQSVREISYSLHPYQIERLGMTKALTSIIDRASKSSGIKFISNLDNIDNELNSEQGINLFRIIQESVNNILKHSKAKEVLFNLNKSKTEISVLISDDGKGFNIRKLEEKSEKYGMGVKGMKERAKLFKGEIEIRSSEDSGTEIKITIPVLKQ